MDQINKRYRICTNCVMDSSDPNIYLDSRVYCGYCNNFEKIIRPHWQLIQKSSGYINSLTEKIRRDGEGKNFDCIIGISGGLDSSYAVYIAKEKLGLRPLVVHIDAGWNTEIAIGNIEKLVDGLGLDLYVEVVNWQDIKALQVAFLKSGIPDQDLVQDAAFFSGLYKIARQHKIKHIITGANFSTECCREPVEWGGYLGIDTWLFNDIYRQFGQGPLESFTPIDIIFYKVFYRSILGIQVHHPLNFFPYIKQDVERQLESRFGWQKLQHKHHESRFTRFYEDYWLPRRFGYDKRRAHFSSLILTGQMTREAALERLSRPEMEEYFLNQEFEYVAHKLDLTVNELQECFDLPKKTYRAYRNKQKFIKLSAKIMCLLNLEKRYFR